MIWTTYPAKGIAPSTLLEAEIGYYNNYIYLAAGISLDSTNIFPETLFRYSLITNLWENATSNTTYTSRSYSGSAVINDYFYLLPGYATQTGEIVRNIMRVSLNSSEFLWEKYIESVALTESSFTTSVKGAYIYIFGGLNITASINLLGYLNTTNRNIHEINPNILAPSPRYSHNMHTINAEIYVFGGMGENGLLNDMWVYNIDSSQWRTVYYQGSVPSARYLAASDSTGDALMIWGGEDSAGLKNDMYFFNTYNYQWVEIIPNSEAVPQPAAGACLVLSYPYIFIYGGITISGISNQLWLFNIITSMYSLLSTDNRVAYPSCVLNHTDFYVIFGSGVGNAPLGSVRKYDINTNSWSDYYNGGYSIDNSAQAIQIFVGSSILKIGGQTWQINPNNKVFLYSNNTKYLIGTIQISVYAMGYTYFGDKIYSFGGGSMLADTLRLSSPSQNFFMIDVNEICSGGLCEALCSIGSYKVLNTCKKCPAGTYSQVWGSNKCISCPLGTYLQNEGGTSSRQCIPCAEGSYNNALGAAYCLDCPATMVCSAGSIAPSVYVENIQNFSLQPLIYKSSSESILFLSYELVTGLAMALAICIILLWDKIRSFLKYFDIYPGHHNHEYQQYMILDKTAIGGIFSLMFFAIAIIIIGTAIITYQTQNIQETKALIPLVVTEEEVSEYVSSIIIIESTFLGYGDACVINGSCSTEIYLKVANIRSDSYKFSCELRSDRSCIVSFSCKNCIIDTGAVLSIVMNEPLSYSSGIKVNVSADSSIPGSISSMTTVIHPARGYVFIGPSASNFFFMMIPSWFESDSSAWPSKLTGYHISNEVLPTPGSEHQTAGTSVLSQLSLNVNLVKDISSLYITRLLKQTFFFTASSIIGSVFGIMGAFGAVMKFIEKQYNRIKIVKQKKKNLEQMMILRKDCLLYTTERESNGGKELYWHEEDDDFMNPEKALKGNGITNSPKVMPERE